MTVKRQELELPANNNIVSAKVEVETCFPVSFSFIIFDASCHPMHPEERE
jgi:hypothetical protein